MTIREQKGNVGEPGGLPVYRDTVDRKLPDPCDANDTDWYPSKQPAKELWRCFTALQKMEYLLEGTSSDMPDQRLRRFLVQFVVPLDDFFICIRDLGAAIVQENQSHLNTAELEYVIEQRKRFKKAVLKKVKPIKLARDKIGAHTDCSMFPSEMTKVVSSLDIHMVGAMFHASLLASQNYCKLDCFTWTGKGYREDEVRLMTCEPFVWSLSTDDPGEVRGIEMTESPKRHVFEKIADLVELSVWMFGEKQTRLVVRERDSC